MAWSFGKNRPQCFRKRIIVIAAEGEVTEPQYFQKLNSMGINAVFSIVENWGNGSDPKAVLKRMEKHLKEYPLGKDDEAWIVIDQDKWSNASFEKVKRWTGSAPNHYYAKSIRRFEDWLKLHVAEDKALEKKYHSLLSGKDKHIPDDFLTKERVDSAIGKAKRLHSTEKDVGNVFEVLESFFKKKNH